LDDAFNHNKEEMKKAAEAARRGDRTDTKIAVESIKEKPFGRNFTPGQGTLNTFSVKFPHFQLISILIIQHKGQK